MSKRHAVPISQRTPVCGKQPLSRDSLLVASAVCFLVFLFFILPLIRISLGEAPT